MDLVAPPPISVCMIVRNEAKTLPRCLSSLQGLYRELIVVDTGSSDSTVSVARSFGAKLECFTGCNDKAGWIVDFALARNTALRLATQAWILQIDADEVLEAGSEFLRFDLEQEIAGCVGVTLRSEGAQWTSGRIFRRQNGLKYVGRVHEYLANYVGFNLVPTVVIHNLPDKTGKETSGERNQRLCRLALADDDSDARSWFYLGSELQAMQDWAQAIECYERVLALKTYPAGAFHTPYSLGVCLLLSGQLEKSIAAARMALAVDSRYAEAHCLLGDACYLLGMFSDAASWYRSAITCGAPPIGALFSPQLWAYKEHPERQLQRLHKYE